MLRPFMKIYVNGKSLELHKTISAVALLELLDYKQVGAALAINELVINKENWCTQMLGEGDDVVLFQVIAGG